LVKVEANILINAPIEKCFDMARDIDIHTRTVWKHTREKAIEGVTTGLIGMDETVTFEATHFGIRQTLTSKIIEFNRPYHFVDEMQEGAFKYLRHVHEFEELNGKTKMTDKLIFEAPYGVLGWLVERFVLKGYMKKFINDRNEQINKLVEVLPKK
jgi:ligand-binding SRPBCC domain-containing protein